MTVTVTHCSGSKVSGNSMFGVFKPLLVWLCQNFFGSSGFQKSFNGLLEHTHVEILKLGMRPVRMRVRNLVNVALLPGRGKVSVPFSLLSVSSCMTGIIRLVFLNEAGCLSSLSSSPLLPASSPHPQRRMEQTLTPLGLQMPGCVQLFVLSVLGCPVLHYKLIVLLLLNHLTRRQEECYHPAVEIFHVSFLYLLFIISFTPSYSFSISNKPIRIQ